MQILKHKFKTSCYYTNKMHLLEFNADVFWEI